MTVQPGYAPTASGTTFKHMVEAVCHEGMYPSRERAEEVIHAVLVGLGTQISGRVSVELAAYLPFEAAVVFTAPAPESSPLTGWEFVKDLAGRTSGTPGTARWDAGSVLRVMNRLVQPDLIDRILGELPPGYSLLFGRSELLQAVPQQGRRVP
ncbi:DUF2267 domain-containing protein [Streptomyces sp. NPDC019396]|uniref:DUF2267 domain-containing protein n=1 Tax=Streptomyces sp. NPDC019396 TaxID=3154687 RepID=UPI0033F039D0